MLFYYLDQYKETEGVIFRDHTITEYHVWFTTVPFKPLLTSFWNICFSLKAILNLGLRSELISKMKLIRNCNLKWPSMLKRFQNDKIFDNVSFYIVNSLQKWIVHSYRRKQERNYQSWTLLKVVKQHVIASLFLRHRSESGIDIFAWRVAWYYYAYSPFNESTLLSYLLD